MYNFNTFKQGIKEVSDRLSKEFSSIRTGRATPVLLDNILVEVYGSQMPLKQVASLAVEDARSVRISPWDQGQAKAVEKAIVASNLGLSVTVDANGLRAIFPELTAERRSDFVKLAKQKLEEARSSLRSHREKIVKEIENDEKAGKISEDDKFRLKNELQKLVDECNKSFETLFEKKEKEITE